MENCDINNLVYSEYNNNQYLNLINCKKLIKNLI